MIPGYAWMLLLLSNACNFETLEASTADAVVKQNILDGEWRYIKLNKLKTKQIGTFKNKSSQLAVDGNLETAIVACNPCDGSTKKGTGWWSIALGKPYRVAAVRLVSSDKLSETNYLQDFEVKVSLNGSDCCLCAKYRDRRDIEPLTQITLLCSEPFLGNEVKVYRPKQAGFKADTISFAEIKIIST